MTEYAAACCCNPVSYCGGGCYEWATMDFNISKSCSWNGEEVWESNFNNSVFTNTIEGSASHNFSGTIKYKCSTVGQNFPRFYANPEFTYVEQQEPSFDISGEGIETYTNNNGGVSSVHEIISQTGSVDPIDSVGNIFEGSVVMGMQGSGNSNCSLASDPGMARYKCDANLSVLTEVTVTETSSNGNQDVFIIPGATNCSMNVYLQTGSEIDICATEYESFPAFSYNSYILQSGIGGNLPSGLPSKRVQDVLDDEDPCHRYSGDPAVSYNLTSNYSDNSGAYVKTGLLQVSFDKSVSFGNLILHEQEP